MLHSVKRSLNLSIAARFAQARRVSEDITWVWPRIMSLVYQQQAPYNLAAYAGKQPDGTYFFNDMDMMEIGNAGVGKGQGIWQNLSVTESRTHFALWSLLKSPMLLGCDLTQQVPEVVSMLQNEEATAFNQDTLGVQAAMVSNVSVFAADTYVVMEPCNTTDQQQGGWQITNGSIRATHGSGTACLTALHPMYEAALLPCNASDPRQQFVYDAKAGSLQTLIRYTEEQATCVTTSFAHAMRGSYVAIGICRTNGPQWHTTPDGLLTSGSSTDSTLARLSNGEKPKESRGDNMNRNSGGAGDTASKLGPSCAARFDQTPIENALGIGQLQVYAGPVTGNGFGAALVNTDSVRAHNITVLWSSLGKCNSHCDRLSHTR